MLELEVRKLTVEYRSGPDRIRPLDGFDLDARAGELALLLGPSGCGKTSLLSCLAGILTPSGGSILFDGVPVPTNGDGLVEHRRAAVGVVFQAFNLVPSLTAAENVAVPLLLAGWHRRAARERSGALLERVNLGDRQQSRPAEMSGGQQQRVAIARALALDPPLLLADEPTAHLDALQVEGVLNILRELAAPGRLVIVSTHDPRLVPLADRVIDMAPKAAPVAATAQTLDLRAGERLFEQGDRGDLVYVVEKGNVEIIITDGDGGTSVVKVVKAGQYFGELAPLLGFPRSASARARTKATVTGYPIAEFRRSFAGRAASPAGSSNGAPHPPARSAR